MEHVAGIAGIVVAVLALLDAVIGISLFFNACRRGKELPWLDPVALQKTPYGRFSDHIQAAHQWLESHHAQDISVRSKDGLTLHGRWVPAQNPRATILLAHGYHSCVLADFGPVLEFYHARGFNLLLPDQRSHGRSEGRYITFGVKESSDMLAWLELHNRELGAWPLILSGISMGASTVMDMADEPLPQNVRGFLVDCGFTSPRDIIATVFSRRMHLPAWPFLWVTDLCARLFAGFSLRQKDSRRTLEGNRLPILFVHGTADHFVPCEMTCSTFAACGGPKQLFLVDGAGHGTSYKKDPVQYQEKISDLLRKALEDLK